MEAIVCIGIVGALVYGTYRLARYAHAARRWRANLAQLAYQREMRRQRVNLLARNLQLALLRLEQAPDFRRAASFAALAKDVPVSFRQRQFHRFRPMILQHMARRLQDGADADALTETLASLLQHLGIASFEADYLRVEAEPLVRPATGRPEPSYESRIAALQADHARRRAALEALPGLNTETREQMLEAEDVRFQEALQAETNHGQASPQTG